MGRETTGSIVPGNHSKIRLKDMKNRKTRLKKGENVSDLGGVRVEIERWSRDGGF